MANYPNILDTPASTAGGAYTLINNYAFNNQAAAIITSIPDSYNSLLFVIDYINTQGVLQKPYFLASLDNGSSYLNTNEYDWQTLSVDQGSAGARGLKGQSTSEMTLADTNLLMSNTGVGGWMQFEFYNYTDAVSNGTMFMSWSYGVSEDSTAQVIGGRGQGFVRITSAMDAFQFYMTSANIDLIGRLYGMT